MRPKHLEDFWESVREGVRPAPHRKSNAEITRMVRCDHHWLKGTEVILTVYPHGELGFRAPHRRTEYRLSTKDAFRQAVLITTAKINARVKQLKREGHSLSEARAKARKELL